ncbi:MAG: PQQ-dependent sugar dehydrogenase [Novosphingobium sp.]|nr:PQQ-dependent sugar dehydrogenase [Novosphingobium sp.]
MKAASLRLLLSPLILIAASCGGSSAGDSAAHAEPSGAAHAQGFTVTPIAAFDEPWAMTFIPGTPYALITEKPGRLKLWQMNGPTREVAGVPRVAYGGQGGLADVQLAPDFAHSGTIYLSYAEAGSGGSGGALARARLVLGLGAPRLDGLQVIWRQQPKVSGELQYALRIAFSPDGKYLFVSSGDRFHPAHAQDFTSNLGKILRLLPDGSPAPGNPFASRGGVAAQFWTLGHRNPLGLKFDAAGRLWGLEHGPAGGDELNLIEPGKNYGWPIVSNGDNYDGTPIPRHSTHPEFAAPVVSWNPVIAPGDFIFCRGDKFPQWRGQALIAGLKTESLIRVAFDGVHAREVGRTSFGHRLREIVEGADGSMWILEDGPGGRLLRLDPHSG